MKRFFLLSLAALATLLPASAGPLSLTLDPVNGQVSGPAGTNIGWGFTLNGDATNWLVVTSVQISGDPFPVGTAANFTDLLSNWMGDALAPGATLTQSWAGGLGLAQFAIPGTSSTNDVSGIFNILVDYDLYAADPFTALGDPGYVDPGPLGPRQFSNSAQITVSAPDTGNVAPEPGTWLLFVTALPLIVVGRRRTRRA